VHVEGLLRNKGAEVVTVEGSTTVADALQTMATRRVGALVVSADGSAVDGIVSERDVVWGLADRGAGLLGETVATIMTRDVVTCGMATTVDQLSTMMTEGRMRHVPVVVDGALAGIVSIGDVVKDRLRELEAETQSLHEYISHGR